MTGSVVRQCIIRSLLLCVFVTCMTLTALPTNAETSGNATPPEIPALSLSAVPVYQFPASLNHGGKVAVTGLSMDVNSNFALSQELGVGLHAGYDYAGYHFTGPVKLAGKKPWDDMHRLELGMNVSYDLTPEWSIYIIPSLQFARENDAGWGNAITYGGIVSFSYDVTPRLTLGSGIAAYNDIDKVSVFPMVIVRWQISDTLLLANPLHPGPTGPAGLELSYRFAKNWDIAAGATYRSNRFRIGNDGVAKDGIGESNFLPVFGRLSWKYDKYVALDAYAGTMFGGSIFVNDRNNVRLASDHYAPAPFAALAFSGKF